MWKSVGIMIVVVIVIGIVGLGMAQEQIGYQPRPEGWRECPFCGSVMAWLIAKYKQRHLTEQYQDLRLAFSWPLKKNSARVYMYACEWGHVWQTLKSLADVMRGNVGKFPNKKAEGE